MIAVSPALAIDAPTDARSVTVVASEYRARYVSS